MCKRLDARGLELPPNTLPAAWFSRLSSIPITTSLRFRRKALAAEDAESIELDYPLYSAISAVQFLSLLLRDDLVLDLVVRGLGNNFLPHQIGLFRIGTSGDDFLRVGRSDAW